MAMPFNPGLAFENRYTNTGSTIPAKDPGTKWPSRNPNSSKDDAGLPPSNSNQLTQTPIALSSQFFQEISNGTLEPAHPWHQPNIASQPSTNPPPPIYAPPLLEKLEQDLSRTYVDPSYPMTNMPHPTSFDSTNHQQPSHLHGLNPLSTFAHPTSSSFLSPMEQISSDMLGKKEFNSAPGYNQPHHDFGQQSIPIQQHVDHRSDNSHPADPLMTRTSQIGTSIPKPGDPMRENAYQYQPTSFSTKPPPSMINPYQPRISTIKHSTNSYQSHPSSSVGVSQSVQDAPLSISRTDPNVTHIHDSKNIQPSIRTGVASQNHPSWNSNVSTLGQATCFPPVQSNQTKTTPNQLDTTKFPNPAHIVNSTKHPSIFHTSSFGCPPHTFTKYMIKQKGIGNCSPRYIRSTFFHIPANKELLNQSNIPLALVVQPLAEPGPTDHPVSIVDIPELLNELRCRCCSAYVNPFVKWLENGRAYTCSLCSTQNMVPQSYFSPVESGGLRKDIDSRIELWQGTVDFVAPIDKSSTPIETEPYLPPTLFLIDTTPAAINSGLLQAFSNSIGQILDHHFSRDHLSKFGFITFAKTVHLWQFTPQPQMFSLPNAFYPFQPLPASCFLVNYATHREVIQDWLQEVLHIETADYRTDANCLGAAINAAMGMLNSIGGGHLIVFQSCRPSFGPGTLKPREIPAQFDSLTGDNINAKEKRLYAVQTKFYRLQAEECVRQNVSVDLFILPNQFVDLCELSDLTQFTGGQIYFIPNFHISQHEETLCYNLKRALTRPRGRNALCCVRCSQGLTVDFYRGHFMRDGNDIEMVNIDCDKTLTVYLKHDGILDEANNAVVQFAMIYTDSCGRRLIRVHTIAFHVNLSLAILYRSTDLESILSVLLRSAILQFGQHSIVEIQKSLISKMTAILAAYRKYCVKQERLNSQLVLPESLKLLPLLILSALKHILFSNGSGILSGYGGIGRIAGTTDSRRTTQAPNLHHPPDPSNANVMLSIVDTRIYYSHLLLTCSLEIICPLFYPFIYSLHPLHDQIQLGNPTLQIELQDSNKSNGIQNDAQQNGQAQLDEFGEKKVSTPSSNHLPLPGSEDFYGNNWLPPMIRASRDYLEPGGVYLMDDTECICIVLMPPVNGAILNRLLNTEGKLSYREEDEFNCRVFRIIEAMRQRRPFYQPVYLFEAQGNNMQSQAFFSQLTEDGSNDDPTMNRTIPLHKMNYLAFLCYLHKVIQTKT